jgi:hypothetical protein
LQGGQNCQASGVIVDELGLTTRMKKYAAKNEPKSMISDAMTRNMPSTLGDTREL